MRQPICTSSIRSPAADWHRSSAHIRRWKNGLSVWKKWRKKWGLEATKLSIQLAIAIEDNTLSSSQRLDKLGGSNPLGAAAEAEADQRRRVRPLGIQAV